MGRQGAGAELVWRPSLRAQAKEEGLGHGAEAGGGPVVSSPGAPGTARAGPSGGTLAPTIEASQAGPRYRETRVTSG